MPFHSAFFFLDLDLNLNFDISCFVYLLDLACWFWRLIYNIKNEGSSNRELASYLPSNEWVGKRNGIVIKDERCLLGKDCKIRIDSFMSFRRMGLVPLAFINVIVLNHLFESSPLSASS